MAGKVLFPTPMIAFNGHRVPPFAKNAKGGAPRNIRLIKKV